MQLKNIEFILRQRGILTNDKMWANKATTNLMFNIDAIYT